MKKLYTLAAALLFGAAALFAQDEQYVQFVELNKAGEYVPFENGATITRSTIETVDDGFEVSVFINSGLYVKTLKDNDIMTRVAYNIKSLPNGRHSICYGNCVEKTETGQFYYPGLSTSGNITSTVTNPKGDPKSLAAEWFCTAEGTAVVEYSVDALEQDGAEMVPKPGGGFISTPKYKVVKSCTITVNYVNDPTGIDNVNAEDIVATEYFDITGKRVAKPANGLFIKKTTDSEGRVKTKKVTM